MDFIRGFFRRNDASDPTDYSDQREKRGSVATAPDYDEAAMALDSSPQLEEFQLLVGIKSHSTLRAPKNFSDKVRPGLPKKGRPAPNRGIYPSVVDYEFKAKQNFKNFQIGINTCLGIQILVAAALTALGASHGSHAAVTVLGAINTVIAGFLTYIKGSGLPMRFKFYAHEWSKIRDFIEQRERDLYMPQSNIDVYAVVNDIRQMYEAVKADVEASQPDRFVSSTGGLKVSSITSSEPALGKDTESDIAGLDGLIGGLQRTRSRVEGLAKTGSAASSDLNRVRSRLVDDADVLKSKLASKIKEVEEFKQGVTTAAAVEAKKVMLVSEHEAGRIVEDRAKQVGDMEKDIESSVTDVRDTMSSAFSNERI